MSLLNKITNAVAGETPSICPVPPDDFVRGYVDAYDRTPIQNRAGTFDGYVHVSSLAKDFCARQYAIAVHEDLPLYETVTGGHRVVWAQGRASEDHLREAFIHQYGIRNIYAHWSCVSGAELDDPEHSHYTGLWKSTKCKCGKALNKHNEAHLYDNENRIVGRPDLIFRYKNWYFIIEIKSIKKTSSAQFVGWEDIDEPMKDHVNQAMWYPDLLSMKDGLKVSPQVRYVYICKDFVFGSPYKEFVVNMDQDKYAKIKKELREESSQLKDFFNADAENKLDFLPPRVCPSFNSPMAKKCALNSRCFFGAEYRDK
jgi:hypothetical protein